MGSGMNRKEAEELASKRSYRWAVNNIVTGKGIKFRKATMIKLHKLAEIADWLDAEQTEPYEDEFEICDSRSGCYGCEHHICKLEQTEPSFKVDGIGDDDPTIHAIAHLQKVGWLQEHDRALTEPQTDCPKTCPFIDICTKDDTDCPWKKGE